MQPFKINLKNFISDVCILDRSIVLMIQVSEPYLDEPSLNHDPESYAVVLITIMAAQAKQVEGYVADNAGTPGLGLCVKPYNL